MNEPYGYAASNETFKQIENGKKESEQNCDRMTEMSKRTAKTPL